jgi:nitroreductase
MNKKDFYNTIFKRKSVRKYAKKSLEESKLKMIEDFIREIDPLYKDIKTEFVLLSDNEVKGMFAIKSPHYIAFYSEVKEGHLLNAGFMLQQMDLFLSENGIGSCWLGMAGPQSNFKSHNNLDFVILLAFGDAEEKLYRNSVAEFNRKDLTEISSVKENKEILEVVRLAPSATNFQPWYFAGDSNKIFINKKNLNFLKAALIGKFNYIDIGISMCYLKIAAEHFGKNIIFNKENCDSEKGYEYICTAYFE